MHQLHFSYITSNSRKLFSSLLVLSFVIINGSLYAQKYVDQEQEAIKAWAALTQILQKEATYFQDKPGRIRLQNLEHTDFTIQKINLSTEQLLFEMYFTNRFFLDDFKKVVQHEVYQFADFNFRIKAVSFLYGDQWYFDDFPKTLWLQIECYNEVILKETTIKEKEPESDDWVAKPTTKTLTNHFILPIRAENSNKILQAINKLQATLLKKDLQNEIDH